jgi:hypothetical protein
MFNQPCILHLTIRTLIFFLSLLSYYFVLTVNLVFDFIVFYIKVIGFFLRRIITRKWIYKYRTLKTKR